MKSESKKEIKMGIGFVTGRANVCEIINHYYQEIIEQLRKTKYQIKVTFFILYDTQYQGTNEEEFYKILPQVFEEFNILYITPEDREKEKEQLEKQEHLTKEEVELFFGNGHAKGRNTVLYFAKKYRMDYLLFWDDDEYPVACIKQKDKIVWEKQDNIIKHVEIMEQENADVTIGYHCGYISPIPYLNVSDDIEEANIADFLEAISNELISYQSIQEKFEKNNGVTYADQEIIQKQPIFELTAKDGNKFVAGSTLCLNLQHIDKIPAFYNPPSARGEDTFFSMNLEKCKVIKVPIYHFHDGFLKYKSIMKGKYPQEFKLMKASDRTIEKRFFKACQGWIKYKPLLLYLLNPENYSKEISKVKRKLKRSIKKINYLFDQSNFEKLTQQLEEYDQKVEEHYQDFIKVNQIWNRLKEMIEKNKEPIG